MAWVYCWLLLTAQRDPPNATRINVERQTLGMETGGVYYNATRHSGGVYYNATRHSGGVYRVTERGVR